MAQKRTRGKVVTIIRSPTPAEMIGEKTPVEPEVVPGLGKAKGWEGLSDEKKLETALRHFGIKRRDVLSYRVYPHKVAIVHGFGQKVEYWPA